MNKHVIPQTPSTDLSRRSFLVGTSATAGLALGYSAVPGLLGADQALAAPASFDPSEINADPTAPTSRSDICLNFRISATASFSTPGQ